MINSIHFFVASYQSGIGTKLDVMLPYDVLSWSAAVDYASLHCPDGYDLQCLRLCAYSLGNLCDIQESQKEKEPSA